MKVISLLGLPGSGKSYYGKKLAKKTKARFIPEIATRLIYEKGYTPGMRGSLDFDHDILIHNIKTAEDVLKSNELTFWEGGPVQDVVFLKGRMNLVGVEDKRRELLKRYNGKLFDKLDYESLYVFFNVDPKVSIERQNLRVKPELLTSNLKLLHYVNDNLEKFCEINKDKVISINVDRSKREIFKEVYNRVLEKIELE